MTPQQLLADDFARNGIPTYIPDILDGHRVTPEHFFSGHFSNEEWIKRHPTEVTRPHIDRLIAGLRKRGVTEFAATGYCLGGRYVTELLKDEALKVGIINHPSGVVIPKDLEAIHAVKHVPMLWVTCEKCVVFEFSGMVDS